MTGKANGSPPHEDAGRFWSNSRLWALLIAVASGFLAAGLNAWLYQKQQPVFDSMSYLERLHRVMTVTTADGWIAGARLAAVQNTVCLPYLASIPLAFAFRPARWIGTAIQTAGYAVFLLVLDHALRRAGVSRASSRIVVMAAFNLLGVVLFSNGGLGDFRMDFSLMLGYGMTCLMLGCALRSGSLWDWAGTGILAGGTCLVRGTAPVYLLFAGLPVLLAHLVHAVRASGRERAVVKPGGIVLGAVVAAAIAAACCGWFYWINYGYLRYYYLEWNTDANARLPLAATVRHLDYVARQIGTSGLLGGLSLLAMAAVWRKEQSGSIRQEDLSRMVWQLELIWLAAVPLGLLVLGGAGPNPYVSMPVTVCLFCAAGFQAGRWHSGLPAGRRRRVAWVLGLLLLATFGRGVKKHGWPNEQFMPAHREAIARIVADARSTGRPLARIAALGTWQISAESLWSAVLFDQPDAVAGNETASVDGVELRPGRLFMLPAEAEWKQIPGNDDRQRCEWLVSRIESDLDYLVIPDEPTANSIGDSVSPDVVNRHVPWLREQILLRVKLTGIGELGSPANPERYGLYRVER